VLSTPSRRNAFWNARLPLTLNTPLKPMLCRRGVEGTTPGDSIASWL
jgi:hypothetical protein